MIKNIKIIIFHIIFLLFLLFILYNKLNNVISKVNIISNNKFTYISKHDLESKIINILNSNNNWFYVDIFKIKKAISTINGIYFILVKKIWPSTLIIYICNHKPISYWNNNLVLDNMQIIKSKTFNYIADLPYIQSESRININYIYHIYKILNLISSRNNMQILKIYYRYNIFSILLSNNIKVILGSVSLKKRLKLFFKYYLKINNYKSIKYFDMRYYNGFAVKYR